MDQQTTLDPTLGFSQVRLQVLGEAKPPQKEATLQIIADFAAINPKAVCANIRAGVGVESSVGEAG